jgi:hypothetical protein
LLCLLALVGVLMTLYWPAASLQGVFYVGDIYRLGYPARHEYAMALREGRIPLWTPNAVAGFPSLAEGQTGAYYPPNLLLYRFLPLPAALNYSILLALWTAGAGVFLYARSLGLRRLPSLVAACAFMLGGFLPGHLNHLNMLAAASWLPLLLLAVERATRLAGWRHWTLVGLLFGVQGLAGHPQISLLSALLLVPYAAAGPLRGARPAGGVWQRAAQAAWCGGALLLGVALAAVQWAPTYELTRLSERGQGLDLEFFTSFSLHPAQYVTMLWPFIRGNPYPLTSLETIGYVGVLPLVLAGAAIVQRRDQAVRLWAVVAVAAFLMSLGRWNPAYRYLMHVPVLNMFRAPARYLLWMDLAICILAAAGADALLSMTRERGGGRGGWLWPAGGMVLLAFGGLSLSRVPLDSLVSSWRLLPLAWLGGAVLLLVVLRWHPPMSIWSALLVGLLMADLGAFNGVYNQTYNAVMAPADFVRVPRVLHFLWEDAGSDRYRVYTSERIVPWLPVMRESLYPNIQLLYGVESVNGYYPLLPEPHRWLLGNLTPRLADLINVRYVLVPQLLPVDEASEAHNRENPFAPPIVGRTFDLPMSSVAALEVEGYLSHSTDLPDGEPVCEITLRGTKGEEVIWTLRAGVDLAEWAYQRDDVIRMVRHSQPQPVARTWPAESGFPAREHVGSTYLARFALAEALEVQQLEVRPLIPAGFLYLERVRLIDPEGGAQLLSELVGEGDHTLVYRSADVAVFRNEGAGPRAFLVHRARRARDDEEAHRMVTSPSFEPHDEVIVLEGEELDGALSPGDEVILEVYEPEYVRLRARTDADAYLVLADSYYPGWRAQVDGRPATLYRANVALRAVALPAGEHVVEMRFAPSSWRLGGWVSGVAWAAMAILAVAQLWRRVGRA